MGLQGSEMQWPEAHSPSTAQPWPLARPQVAVALHTFTPPQVSGSGASVMEVQSPAVAPRLQAAQVPHAA
jgi:hypothetical protein